jgi:hypothetical protein
MRGQKSYTAGTIVDLDGRPRYYILPNKLILFAIASMIVIVIVTVVMGLVVIYNRNEIEGLKDKIEVQEQEIRDK